MTGRRVSNRRLRLAAYLLVVALGAYGFWRVEQVQRESCERGNDFRQDDMPAAFAEYTHLLGEEFEASPERIEQAVAKFDGRLHELFPTRDCGWWP